VVAVLHQLTPVSTVVQVWYTTPLCLKGNTQSPAGVEQEDRPRLSAWQEVELELTSQSPQLLVITLPSA